MRQLGLISWKSTRLVVTIMMSSWEAVTYLSSQASDQREGTGPLALK